MSDIDKVARLLDTIAQLQIAVVALVVVGFIVYSVFRWLVPALTKRRDSTRPPRDPFPTEEVTGRFATTMAQNERLRDLHEEIREINEALAIRGGKSRLEVLLEEILASLKRLEEAEEKEVRLLTSVASEFTSIRASQDRLEREMTGLRQ